MCGMKSETGENWITYHHNWFDHSDSRMAREELNENEALQPKLEEEIKIALVPKGRHIIDYDPLLNIHS